MGSGPGRSGREIYKDTLLASGRPTEKIVKFLLGEYYQTDFASYKQPDPNRRLMET